MIIIVLYKKFSEENKSICNFKKKKSNFERKIGLEIGRCKQLVGISNFLIIKRYLLNDI